jgi:probable rRNA maturation factor
MSDYRIETNDRQSAIPVDVSKLEAAVIQVLKTESISQAEVSIAIVDSIEMRRINNQYLAHDYDTDVLSFLLEETATASGERSIEGEVIVSAGMAEQQATTFGWNTDDELSLYVVHGTLHLCGYDDQTPELKAVMREQEILNLGQLGLTPRYA